MTAIEQIDKAMDHMNMAGVNLLALRPLLEHMHKLQRAPRMIGGLRRNTLCSLVDCDGMLCSHCVIDKVMQ